MEPSVDYKTIVQELRDRLADTGGGENSGSDQVRVRDRFRWQLAHMLDDDPMAPLDLLLERLAEKWKRDGLL